MAREEQLEVTHARVSRPHVPGLTFNDPVANPGKATVHLGVDVDGSARDRELTSQRVIQVAVSVHVDLPARNSSAEVDHPLGQNLGVLLKTVLQQSEDVVHGGSGVVLRVVFDVICPTTNQRHIKKSPLVGDPERVIDLVPQLEKEKKRILLSIPKPKVL